MRKSPSSCLIFGVTSVTIALGGCSPNRVPKPEAPGIQPREQASTITQNDWMPRQTAVAARYQIDDSSSISISGDSSHISVFQTTTFYSLEFIALADSISIIAKIDSTSTNPHRPVERNSTDKVSPQVTHALISSTGQLSVLPSEVHLLCQGGVDPGAMRVFELVQSYPKRRIRVGDKWADTVSATNCRGKTALHQQIIREYELLELTDWKGQAVAKIQRTVSSTLVGSNSDAQNHLSASGAGKSFTIIYVDRASGLLRKSDGSSESTLTISTSRGSYPFEQKITTQIEIQ